MADQIIGLCRRVSTEVPFGRFSPEFVASEWTAIIDPWNLTKWEDYKAFDRKGRKTSLQGNDRSILWPVFEKVRQTLSRNKLVTWNQLCTDAASVLQSVGPIFTHVLVDEAQLLGPAELRFVRALAHQSENDLFFALDGNQRIYSRQPAWSGLGIDISGRSWSLNINYRTTKEIEEFARRFITATNGTIDSPESQLPISFLEGAVPTVESFDSIELEITGVAEWLSSLWRQGYEPRDIAILARTDALLRERAEPALRKAGMRGHLRDQKSVGENSVTMLTMATVAGFEV